MEDYRKEIREYLERTNAKPYHLATWAGIAPAVLYNWLRGKSWPNLKSVERIFEAMEKYPGPFSFPRKRPGRQVVWRPNKKLNPINKPVDNRDEHNQNLG